MFVTCCHLIYFDVRYTSGQGWFTSRPCGATQHTAVRVVGMQDLDDSIRLAAGACRIIQFPCNFHFVKAEALWLTDPTRPGMRLLVGPVLTCTKLVLVALDAVQAQLAIEFLKVFIFGEFRQ